jgi:hypothetical protein
MSAFPSNARGRAVRSLGYVALALSSPFVWAPACARGTASVAGVAAESFAGPFDGFDGEPNTGIADAEPGAQTSSDPGAVGADGEGACGAASDDAYGDAVDSGPAEDVADAAETDGSASANGAEEPDGGATDPGATLPAVGDLLITEIMFDPAGPVPESQWFEVYNTTASPLLLGGLTIEDGWADTETIASSPPVVAPAYTYVLLARDEQAAIAAGISAASIVYAYGTGLSPDDGIELASDFTGDLSLWNGATELADVPYGTWGLDSEGQSIELGTLETFAENDPDAWCLAELPWGSGTDDGTPGLPNDCP